MVLTAGFIDTQLAFENYFAAVLNRFATGNRLSSEDDAIDLREGVLQREINVAGTLRAAICNFTACPDCADVAFKQLADVSGQFTYGKNAARDFGRKKFASKIPL